MYDPFAYSRLTNAALLEMFSWKSNNLLLVNPIFLALISLSFSITFDISFSWKVELVWVISGTSWFFSSPSFRLMFPKCWHIQQGSHLSPPLLSTLFFFPLVVQFSTRPNDRLYEFSRVSITNYHKQGDLNQLKFVIWKPKVWNQHISKASRGFEKYGKCFSPVFYWLPAILFMQSFMLWLVDASL